MSRLSIGRRGIRSCHSAVQAAAGRGYRAGRRWPKPKGSKARTPFATLLRSAQEAEAFLRDLAEFAVRTPLDLSGLQDASRQLLASGFHAEIILSKMTAVGDTVSALGGGAAEKDYLGSWSDADERRGYRSRDDRCLGTNRAQLTKMTAFRRPPEKC